MYIYKINHWNFLKFCGNEVILLVKLNPPKDSCNCHRTGIIKLFINLLKARVVTKPSSGDVAFIPYIDLAPRPNPHSFHSHNRSQFAWHSPTHWPHVPGCYITASSLLPNSSAWKACFSSRISLHNWHSNVKYCLKKLSALILIIKKITTYFFHL